MDRQELARFLRSRRERITPADVGLPAGSRRRTPGLRREEVAQLAYISIEYYTRLEQARAPRPSPAVMGGLSRALRLTDAECDHLHLLAGTPAARASGPSRLVRQSILDLIDRLPLTAVIVTSADGEVLAWNNLAAALMEDFSALSRRDRNLLRRSLLDLRLDGRGLYGVSDLDEFRRASVFRLRATAARYPDDPQVTDLVEELLVGSETFAELWASHDVAVTPVLSKTFEHPQVGTIAVNCDVLDIADRDQQVVLYTAAPGSSAEEALRLLAVVGTQRMDSAL